MELDVTAIGELLIDFTARAENDAGYPVMEANPGGAGGLRRPHRPAGQGGG